MKSARSTENSRLRSTLESAWSRRVALPIWKTHEALRIFHGPGEAAGTHELLRFAIEKFGEHAFVTEWEPREGEGPFLPGRNVIADFLRSKNFASSVILLRLKKGTGPLTEVLFGTPPLEKITVHEGSLKSAVQFQGTRHPGLFLDHEPLRGWLQKSVRSDMRVLNTFSYTGSLSVAAGVHGAHVTTLDLGRPVVEWAHENWKLNELPEDRGEFIVEDYFIQLPKFKKQGRAFNLILLDPPSFSRGKRGTFSTAQDLVALHELAFDVLAPGGILCTSVNSASLHPKKFEAEVREAFKKIRGASHDFQILQKIRLPEGTFPGDDYLKGFILKT